MNIAIPLLQTNEQRNNDAEHERRQRDNHHDFDKHHGRTPWRLRRRIRKNSVASDVLRLQLRHVFVECLFMVPGIPNWLVAPGRPACRRGRTKSVPRGCVLRRSARLWSSTIATSFCRGQVALERRGNRDLCRGIGCELFPRNVADLLRDRLHGLQRDGRAARLRAADSIRRGAFESKRTKEP